MKISPVQVLGFLVMLVIGAACQNPFQKDSPREQEHPKLIKTIGDPNYGNVQCILQDRDGNLWFGTTENGLYKYDGKSFSRFLVADGLNSNGVYSLLEDKDGKLWIGTEAGLCLYDGKTFTEIQIPLPQNLPPNRNPRYLNAHWVYSIMQARSGKMWFATIDGMYTYDGRSFTLFSVDEMPNGFLTSNDKVERMLEDKDGNVWFGGRTNEGVYRYDGKTITNFKLETLFQNGPKPKPHQWAWPQWQDKNGNIWFSNWGGAYRYDGKSFTGFSRKDGLPGNVTRIIEDRKGELWFGGDGLSRYDGKLFTNFTTKDGLASPGVWSLLEDVKGDLWIGTRQTGLYLYDGRSFIAYSEYGKQPAKKEQSPE